MNTQGIGFVQPLRGRSSYFAVYPGFDEYIEPWALECNPVGVEDGKARSFLTSGYSLLARSLRTLVNRCLMVVLRKPLWSMAATSGSLSTVV